VGELAPYRFFTVDPGLDASGIARWRSGVLEDVRLLRVPYKMRGKSVVERIVRQSHELQDYLASLPDWAGAPIVGERMKHRGRTRGKRPVPPDDLINLSLLSGALCSYWLLPSEWKSSVPREVEQSHSKSKLSPEELALVEAVMPASLRKEAWSAVGIGLSILGRCHLRCGWGGWS